MSVLSEAQVGGDALYNSPDEGYFDKLAEQSGVCLCSFLSPPTPLSSAQVPVQRPLGDRYKWKRPHTASLFASVRQKVLAQERQMLGNR